jgi:hypothetical protein
MGKGLRGGPLTGMMLSLVWALRKFMEDATQ